MRSNKQSNYICIMYLVLFGCLVLSGCASQSAYQQCKSIEDTVELDTVSGVSASIELRCTHYYYQYTWRDRDGKNNYTYTDADGGHHHFDFPLGPAHGGVISTSYSTLDKANIVLFNSSPSNKSCIFYYNISKGQLPDKKSSASFDTILPNEKVSHRYIVERGTSRILMCDDIKTSAKTLNAMKVLHAKAEAGEMAAQYFLGILYLGETPGEGVKLPAKHQDNKKAQYWLASAAKQGSRRATRWLGHIFENGIGVEKDKAVALNFYKRAADKGEEYSKKKVKELGQAE